MDSTGSGKGSMEALVNAIEEFWIPQNTVNYLTSWAIINFPWRPQFHGVTNLISYWSVNNDYNCKLGSRLFLSKTISACAWYKNVKIEFRMLFQCGCCYSKHHVAIWNWIFIINDHKGIRGSFSACCWIANAAFGKFPVLIFFRGLTQCLEENSGTDHALFLPDLYTQIGYLRLYNICTWKMQLNYVQINRCEFWTLALAW